MCAEGGGELSEVVVENGEGVNDDTKLAHINHSLEDLIRSVLIMNWELEITSCSAI